MKKYSKEMSEVILHGLNTDTRCKIKEQLKELTYSYYGDDKYNRIKQRIKELDYERDKLEKMMNKLRDKCPSCDNLRKRLYTCSKCSIKRCKGCMAIEGDKPLCGTCHFYNHL